MHEEPQRRGPQSRGPDHSAWKGGCLEQRGRGPCRGQLGLRESVSSHSPPQPCLPSQGSHQAPGVSSFPASLCLGVGGSRLRPAPGVQDPGGLTEHPARATCSEQGLLERNLGPGRVRCLWILDVILDQAQSRPQAREAGGQRISKEGFPRGDGEAGAARALQAWTDPTGALEGELPLGVHSQEGENRGSHAPRPGSSW